MGASISREHHEHEVRRLEGEKKAAEAHAQQLKVLVDEREREHARLVAEQKALAADRKAEQELKKMELELKEAELVAAKEAERKAREALEKGRRPVKKPTKEQEAMAKKRVGVGKLHLAVCGTSGSGKSSLINALRGLEDQDSNAAKVGVTETTKSISSYTDQRPNFNRFVWHDIPGAGTIDVPDWQYFNDQGLFVFDFIIIPYGDRLTDVDIGIIKNCYRFNIPVFAVRSKSDQHIENMVKSQHGFDSEDEGWASAIKKMRKNYAQETRIDFNRNMKQSAKDDEVDEFMGKWLKEKLKLYLVSAAGLRKVVHVRIDPVEGHVLEKLRARLLDEEELVDDILRAGALQKMSSVLEEEEQQVEPPDNTAPEPCGRGSPQNTIPDGTPLDAPPNYREHDDEDWSHV